MVCANSKQKEAKPPLEIGLYMYYFGLFEMFSVCNSAWIYGVFQINRTSEVNTCKI